MVVKGRPYTVYISIRIRIIYGRQRGPYIPYNRCSVPPECDPVPGCFCTGDTGGGGGGTGQWSLAAVVILVKIGYVQQIDSSTSKTWETILKWYLLCRMSCFIMLLLLCFWCFCSHSLSVNPTLFRPYQAASPAPSSTPAPVCPYYGHK